ncbi:MAG: ArsR family transcriptional regulator [Sphingomonadales bacterium]|nr:MAG: ArsR family transcriptional regulator [Sphingomonadales bacterium]TNF04420.1 MAG: ArsR family transcriptional regulator [Sphingomonadales bacterium]
MNALTDKDIDSIVDMLKVLGHELRLKLIHTLRQVGEKSVGELETLTGIGQPGLSQQLAILRKAELVRTRRESKLVFYSLEPEALIPVARLLENLADLEIAPPASNPRTARARARNSAATFARIL